MALWPFGGLRLSLAGGVGIVFDWMALGVVHSKVLVN